MSIALTTLIYVKCRYCTFNRSSWLERGSFSVSCGINFMTSSFLYTINIFILDFGLLHSKLHFLQKRQEYACSHLVHFCYCHYAIKYLMRDMMNYHCLRVLRSRVRRIGNTRPVFLCSEPECMTVPMLSRAVFRSRAPSWRFFFLAISIIHARQVINEFWRFSLIDRVE